MKIVFTLDDGEVIETITDASEYDLDKPLARQALNIDIMNAIQNTRRVEKSRENA